ncbi:ribonuclease D [Thermodesulforhabdus norvegica]|uniref:Ribonuclease D n=1 Tax=Thermodesulforhabdus norvegica TaxID=39841 RepID=A0A1I4QIG2_9BACT|nr:ribonuclease D [Thermodesulforhabdus norvegica]SFM39878.1 ribonuclease D [Thermodesulforhabdus norvegica]
MKPKKEFLSASALSPFSASRPHPPSDELIVSLITRPEELEQLAIHLARCPAIALDTESNGFYAYYEKVCLIQISDGRVSYIIDPLELGDCLPLKPLLESPDIEKIMHDGVNDVSGLYRDFGIRIDNLFDTAVACRLLGRKRRSLAALVEDYLGIRINKKGQQYNWGSRPLKDSHIEYAALDVHYLLIIAQRLKDELAERGLLELAYEKSRGVARSTVPERSFPPDGYTRIKGFWDLGEDERRIVKGLYRWRDFLARRWDRAPFRVMPDIALVELAVMKPADESDLRGLKGIPRRFKKGGLARELLRVIKEWQGV